MTDGKPAWPPIITGGNVPFRIVFRDTVLTLIMWAAIIYGVVVNLDVAVQAAKLLLGQPVNVTDPVIVPFLGRLERRVWIIAILVTILGISTLISRRRRKFALLRPQPNPLADDLLASNLGLSEQGLGEIRGRKIVALDVESDGNAVLARASESGLRGG